MARPAVASRPPVRVAVDAFFGLSQIDAAKKFLRIAGRPQHTTEIAEALGRGGLKRPGRNVMNTILNRAAKRRELTRAGKGVWALPYWRHKNSRPAPGRRPR